MKIDKQYPASNRLQQVAAGYRSTGCRTSKMTGVLMALSFNTWAMPQCSHFEDVTVACN